MPSWCSLPVRHKPWPWATRLFLVAAVVFCGCNGGVHPVPTDSPAKLDGYRHRNVPDTKVGQLLSEHLDTIYATGSDVGAKYLSSLNTLRTYSPEVIVTLVSMYDGTERSLYGLRQTLIQTLAELKLDEASSALIRISTEPISSPKVRNGNSLSLYDEEILLRQIAMQGLAHLAVSNDAAAGCLGELARDTEPAVREEALRSMSSAIGQVEDRDRRAFLRQLLPPGALLESRSDESQPLPPAGARSDLKPPQAK